MSLMRRSLWLLATLVALALRHAVGLGVTTQPALVTAGLSSSNASLTSSRVGVTQGDTLNSLLGFDEPLFSIAEFGHGETGPEADFTNENKFVTGSSDRPPPSTGDPLLRASRDATVETTSGSAVAPSVPNGSDGDGTFRGGDSLSTFFPEGNSWTSWSYDELAAPPTDDFFEADSLDGPRAAWDEWIQDRNFSFSADEDSLPELVVVKPEEKEHMRGAESLPGAYSLLRGGVAVLSNLFLDMPLTLLKTLLTTADIARLSSSLPASKATQHLTRNFHSRFTNLEQLVAQLEPGTYSSEFCARRAAAQSTVCASSCDPRHHACGAKDECLARGMRAHSDYCSLVCGQEGDGAVQRLARAVDSIPLPESVSVCDELCVLQAQRVCWSDNSCLDSAGCYDPGCISRAYSLCFIGSDVVAMAKLVTLSEAAHSGPSPLPLLDIPTTNRAS